MSTSKKEASTTTGSTIVASAPTQKKSVRTRADAAAAAATASSLQTEQDAPEMLAQGSLAHTGASKDRPVEANDASAAAASTVALAHQSKRRKKKPKEDDLVSLGASASSRRASSKSSRSARSNAESIKRIQLEKIKMAKAKAALEIAQANIAIIEAESRIEAASQSEGEDNNFEFEAEKSTHVEQWVDKTATFAEKPTHETRNKCDVNELAEAIVTTVKAMQLPPQQVQWRHVELPHFNGAHEEWLPFKRTFLDTASQFTDVQNMARLRNAVRGVAKETIRSLLFASSDPQEIIDALEQVFGRPERLVLAELENVKTLHKLEDPPVNMHLFVSKVRNTVVTIQALNQEKYLYSPEISRCIVDKLSPILRHRWLEYNKTCYKDEPDLVKLKKFLEIEADLETFAPPEIAKKGKIRHPVHAVQSVEIRSSTASTTKRACHQCGEDHWLTECKRFREVSVDDRWEIAKKHRVCFRCLKGKHMRKLCRGKACTKCKLSHHWLLHTEKTPATTEEPKTSKEESKASTSYHVALSDQTKITKPAYTTDGETMVYLKVMPVEVYGPTGSTRILALLDEGSSVSLIDASIAKKIGATGEKGILSLATIDGEMQKKSENVDILIRGTNNEKKELTGVYTRDKLRLSPQSVRMKDIKSYKHLRGLENELVYEWQRPALLIGHDHIDLIATREIREDGEGQPMASLTHLGWVLHGYFPGEVAQMKSVNHCCILRNEENIEDVIKKHFELESIGIQQRRPSNDADERALDVLKRTTKRLPDGRFESGLIWKTDTITLPNNYVHAYSRLKGIEKKLNKDTSMKEEYERQLRHLLESGYAEEAPASCTPGRTFYLPHFAVTHPTKKKIRIVFDAAARFEGRSLNDALLPGPDLLQPLFGVLLRFRQKPVAVVADIKEMFLQIRIREADRDCLRFLWRNGDTSEKPKEYRMTSVIFGAASSPATAIFVKNLNAEGYKEDYPEAAQAIVRNHYMDDYLQSFASVEEASRTAAAVTTIHKAAGFELRQWVSNKKEALCQVSRSDDTRNEVQLSKNAEEKALGLRWLPEEDNLVFNVGLRNTPREVIEGTRAPTKREVTSAVMSTFDPMGLVAPVLIKGKRLIQEIWRYGTKWDDSITEESDKLWQDYMKDVMTLKRLKIPRCISPSSTKGQLHTFVDASETAYAAAVYWRTIGANGDAHITLIAGKARVAPIKPVSIPRLELQAALLGARLADTIAKEMDLEITDKIFWSDSTTVLQWIKSDPRRFKTFVAHRLAEIEDLTKPHEWRWVPSKENPADDATRQMLKEFDSQFRWFYGPKFLYQTDTDWPVKSFWKTEPTGEEKSSVATVATISMGKQWALPDPNRFSTWARLLRSTARIFGFLLILEKSPKTSVNAVKHDQWRPNKKKKIERVCHPQKTEKRKWIPIPEEHLRKAERALIKRAQYESFGIDIERIEEKLPLERSSKLKKLDVSLDEYGILRLNCRTAKIENIEAREKRLPVLDGKHKIVQLLIDHYHRHFYHANHATVINELRQKYWILSLRNSVKKILHQCQWCRVRKAKLQMPPTGDLPAERLQHSTYPFTCTAVDYFGPMQVTIGRRKEKRWGVLFTCLTTRAVHLELACSLSASSMIMALRRMAARRGSPRVLYSDNGTNFVGANNELRMEAQKMKSEDIFEAAEREGIQWKFTPPGAPHMGGAWERMVRTVKVALTAILHERSPPEEVLHTLLTEVEHTVNSRPLTHLSTEPGDEESLTPNHFLIGRSCGSTDLGIFNDANLVGKANWRTAQRLADHFWRRWIREYLPNLMPRKITGRDTTDPQKGDIVIIADSSLPRNTWPRGEIIETYVGPDGRTRVVDVRTTSGVLKRPTSRLIVIVPASSRPG